MKTPGLPTDFKLAVVGEDLDDMSPADIGDFLDEEDRSLSPRADQRPKPKEVSTPSEKLPQNIAGYIGRESVPKIQTEAPQVVTKQGRGDIALNPNANLPVKPQASAPKPPRRQFNMTPQSMQMVDDLVNRIQRYSNENYPSGSELIRALVAAAYEARELLDLSRVPARGHWGSQTAKIFEDSLKSSIQRAIAQHQMHKGEPGQAE